MLLHFICSNLRAEQLAFMAVSLSLPPESVRLRSDIRDYWELSKVLNQVPLSTEKGLFQYLKWVYEKKAVERNFLLG